MQRIESPISGPTSLLTETQLKAEEINLLAKGSHADPVNKADLQPLNFITWHLHLRVCFIISLGYTTLTSQNQNQNES